MKSFMTLNTATGVYPPILTLILSWSKLPERRLSDERTVLAIPAPLSCSDPDFDLDEAGVTWIICRLATRELFDGAFPTWRHPESDYLRR